MSGNKVLWKCCTGVMVVVVAGPHDITGKCHVMCSGGGGGAGRGVCVLGFAGGFMQSDIQTFRVLA